MAATTTDTEAFHGHKEPYWALTIFTPLTSLNSAQSTVLVLAAAAGAVVTFITSAYVNAYPDVFYTGPLGAGQLAGFFGCYFAAALAVILHFGSSFASNTAATPSATVGAAGRGPFSEEFGTIVGAAAEFGGYMLLFYLADRTTIIPRAEKRHDMNLFWGLWALLVVGALFTLRKAKPPQQQQATAPSAVAAPAAAAAIQQMEEGEMTSPNAPALPPKQAPAVFHVKHLQRDQTEEWKGWMQVMFLWYHYFNATEIYNVIRLYIAAYVWMTGFGNFSYYYIKKDFCMNRFVAMQWRLNFMVTWVCAILGNEYMLYYICPLHTIFTLMIYFGLGIRYQINYTQWGLFAKFAILFAIAAVMWDVKGVFQTVWAPLTFLLKYNDPYRPTRALLSEWEFRTFLDHFVWIVGMFMACNHPRFDLWLEKLDALPVATSNGIKATVVSSVFLIGYWYYVTILSLPKKEYNAIHPYTSFIPIILFIILRNIFTVARQYHLHLFEFLGKTTLETYIAQFHIWMATTGLNGSPKTLLRVLPEEWFISNFLLMSVLFFAVSYRLFQCTNAIKPLLVPSKASDDTVKRNVALGAFLVGALYVVCAVCVMARGTS